MSVFVNAQTVRLPPSGGTTVTTEIDTPVGPKKVTQTVGGTPGGTVTIPAKFIKIPLPPKRVNKGYDVQTKTRTIEFDDISIGGNANPRFTVPIQTDRQTTRINTDLNDLQNSFDESKDNFIELTNLLESHLSKRHYIN